MSDTWRKSTFSNSQGACVEVASYRKSTHSVNNGQCVEVGDYRTSGYSVNNGACVEIGAGGAQVGVRDTKDPDRTVTLEFGSAAWGQFLDGLR